MVSFVPTSVRDLVAVPTVGANEKHLLSYQDVACHLLLQMDKS
jgi:hypothetical protein